MPSIDKITLNGDKTQITKINLSDHVFGIEPHEQAVFDVVTNQRAKMRQGTHATKNRSLVSGGGKKPYKQKGTGRARQGSTRSPQWVGGGVVFGPTPHSYGGKVNQKVRQLALRSALSHHVKNNSLIVIDELKFDIIKTKQVAQLLKTIKATGKVLFLDLLFDDNFVLSAKNIPSVMIQTVNRSSVYDILNANTLVLSAQAVQYFENTYNIGGQHE